MNDKRPVNLDMRVLAMNMPITGIVSILHRVSGAALFFGVAVLFWLLGESLSGPEGFEQAQACLQSFWGKLVVWVVVAALIYHSLAGVKHLIMDMGVGESMEGGIRGAKLVILCSVVLIVLAGYWIW